MVQVYTPPMRTILVLVATLATVSAQTASVLTPRPYFTEPAISPDRSEIAFVSGGDIWAASSQGGEARLLVSHPANESRPLYAPDGSRLAFTSNRTGGGDIYVLNFATNDVTRFAARYRGSRVARATRTVARNAVEMVRRRQLVPRKAHAALASCAAQNSRSRGTTDNFA